MAESPMPPLPIILAPIIRLDHGTKKNQCGILKVDAVISEVASPLVLVPLNLHCNRYTNVDTIQAPPAAGE
jgi:hypothetical protein